MERLGFKFWVQGFGCRIWRDFGTGDLEVKLLQAIAGMRLILGACGIWCAI